MVDEATGPAILHEETLRELGLSEQPFVDGKKPHRFTDSEMQKIRASLEQHARFGEPVHLLLGETGVGKTVLLSQLIKHCKSSIKPFVAKGSDGFVAEAFLAAVLNQLNGDECDNMTELVESLTPQFSELQDQQFSVVLAIDDAHLAPVEEIAELINIMPEFNEGSDVTARLLLTGEPKLKSSLDAIASEYDDMTFEPSVSKVSALTETQMRDYLSSRLNHVGHTDVFPFTEKALGKIHRDSAGLPARINTEGAHYLNNVYANAAAGKKAGGLFATLGWPLLALGAAAVGLIVWGLSMFLGGNDAPEVVEVKPPAVVANAPEEIKLVDNNATAESASLTDTTAAKTPELINDTTNTSPDADSTINSAIENLSTNDLANKESDDNLLLPANPQTPADTERLTSGTQESTITTSDSSLQSNIDQTAEQTSTELTDSLSTDNAQLEQIAPTSESLTTEGTSGSSSDTNQTDVVETVIGSSDNVVVTDAIEPTEITTIASPADTDSDSTLANSTTPAASDSSSGSSTQANRNAVTVNDSEALDLQNEPDSDAASAETNGVAVPVPAPVPVQLPSVDNQNGSVPSNNAQSTPVVVRAVENERWVLFQEPTHFTVQLATSRERNYILELAQGLNTESPVAIYPFKTTNSQNPVFGLLSGLYKTRTEAINAVEQMPRDLKRFGVWIRPISDLQADIKRNQQ